jgi:catechol 2,3-dioxygenase-like lactoylglutathione lyase family enzyme
MRKTDGKNVIFSIYLKKNQMIRLLTNFKYLRRTNMAFQSIIPILYSSDVAESIRYYTEILGFSGSWKWDEPPTFGGVDREDVRIFFCKDGQGQRGTWLAINVDDVDAYHETINARGAKILCPPQSYEWGMREILVEDPDGHRIRFGHGISVREKSKPEMPGDIQIIPAIPTTEELTQLMVSVGWVRPDDNNPANIPPILNAYTVIAKNKTDEKIIGCAYLLTDNAGFYYMKNVIVHPDWQGKRIGTAMVQKLDDWLKQHAAANSMVALHTGPQLAPFYRQFGFSTTFSMQKKVLKQ